jgi:hypothetical protein
MGTPVSRATTRLSGVENQEAIGRLIRDLRSFGDESKKALRELNFAVASQLAEAARAKAMRDGGAEAKAAATLRASNTVAYAQVMYGGMQAYPYTGGAEFGAYQNQPRATKRGTVLGWNQFDHWLAQRGHFLFPTYHEDKAALVAEYVSALKSLERRYFWGKTYA